MCGIAGYIGLDDKKLIHQMSEDIKHRGPDGEGFYINKNIALLNRRLAIIDRKGGDQPIFNEDKTLAVVYNGEIYNYIDLKTELEQKGHIFTTKTDTEIIVHAYEEWQDQCFAKFNGMFGIALYDIPNQKLILARDHFGIKPLYYSILDDKTLIFASEIRAIINTKLIEITPNDRIIYRYLKFRIHDDQKETFFDNVNHLMPGELLTWHNHKIVIKKFADLEEEISTSQSIRKNVSQKDISNFHDLLYDSIRLRLVSEVPIGSCLSGGLDSSIIVAIVNQIRNKKDSIASQVGSHQNTFSAIFPGEINDEEQYINDIITKLPDLKSHKIYPKAYGLFQDMREFIETQEEPTISTGPYAQFKVMQKVSQEVTVILDGQGPDEMMAGYLPYYFTYLRELYKEKKYWSLVIETIEARDVIFKYIGQKFRLFFQEQNTINPDKLISNSFSEKYKDETFHICTDNLKIRLAEDTFRNSLPSLLRYEDKNAMHFSIEGRVPFLDFRLLRFIYTLPVKAILNKGWNKHILREATRQYIPKSIANRRRKIGFTTPEYAWFKENPEEIRSIFASESFATRKYFDQNAILTAFDDFINNENDDTMIFWRFYCLEIWLRIFIDPK